MKAVHLSRSEERVDAVDELARRAGGRVGIGGVLGDLNRTATRTEVPGSAPVWGFRWNEEDQHSRRWFPQGITTSADQGETEDLAGRPVLCTSWYSHNLGGVHKGARLTFVDLTDPARLRYRHVLLVDGAIVDGRLTLQAVRVHAGGIVWHGPFVHVAGTGTGLRTFRLDDIVRAPVAGGDPGRLGARPDGRLDTFGYRYLLPLRFRYDAFAAEGFEPIRYSFLSVDRGSTPHHLVAGEYGRGGRSTRLVRFELDPDSSLLCTDHDGNCRPIALDTGGVEGMQGATVVRDVYYLTTSAGPWIRGSLHVGRPGDFRHYRRVLPAGPEDITYWPSTGQLWSLTEHPSRRYVYVMDLADFPPRG